MTSETNRNTMNKKTFSSSSLIKKIEKNTLKKFIENTFFNKAVSPKKTEKKEALFSKESKKDINKRISNLTEIKNLSPKIEPANN